MKLYLTGLLTFIIWITPICSQAQMDSADIVEYIKNVEYPQPFLQKLESFGNKEAGKPGLDSTYRFLKSQMEEIGYKGLTQSFLYNNDTLKNLEFTKKGSNDSCIIMGAHYDSWVGAGVNDNGTGNFALVQLAKWILKLNVKYSVRFVFFSGEEINYLGSKYYVQTLNNDSVKIKFMVNFDQLGGTIGEDNGAIKCEWDDISPKSGESIQIARYMQKCYNTFTSLTGKLDRAFASDYISFRDSGYIIAGIYQNSSFPYYHTKDDLLKYVDMDALVLVVKGALSFLLSINEASFPVKPDINVYTTQSALIISNASGSILEVYNMMGQKLLNKNLIKNVDSVDLDFYTSGVYIIRIFNDYIHFVRKVYVEP